MRIAVVLLCAFLAPLPLLAQYPEAGKYTAGASAPGSTQVIPLTITVDKKGDSTTVHVSQPSPEGEAELPVVDQRAYKSGFEVVIGVVDGGLACRFAPPDREGRWEANCESPDKTSQFVFFFKKGP